MRVGQPVTWKHGEQQYYGVIATDPFSCCADSEEPVHPFREGFTGVFVGMESSDLQPIADSDIPDEFRLTQEHTQKVCKFGQGEKTCKFLVVAGGDGFQCAKGSCVELIWDINFKSGMNAKGDNCPGRIGSALLSKS